MQNRIHDHAVVAVIVLHVVSLQDLVGVAVSDAQAFQTLYMFNGGTDGSTPMAGLTLDGKGNLYAQLSLAGSPRAAAPDAGRSTN